jgi:riboflavin-specific deaminase-like protein
LGEQPLRPLHATADVVGRVLHDLRAAETRRTTNGRPFVTLSWAQSLDGSIALERGRRYAVSGPESLALTHALRATHDAILIGIGTLLADDPALTVRHWQGPNPSPVVLDSRLRTPPSARLITLAQERGRRGGAVQPVRIACTTADAAERARLEEQGVEVLCLPAWKNGWVDLDELLRALYEAGVTRVMVEGGAKVLTSFLRASLGDYAVVTVAPFLAGGLSAVGKLNGSLPRLRGARTHHLAEDWVLAGPLAWGEA